MILFEKVSRFQNDSTLSLPQRKTKFSAGYDFEVAEDIIIPPYKDLISRIEEDDKPWTLNEVATETKRTKAKPTLVPTGIKCSLDPNTYLELSVRSSCPLKNWLILANGVGIIDADYYNNPDNEGEIYFQIINLFKNPIILHKGDRIGQGIIKKYLTTDNDTADGTRIGGFGSTGN